MCTPHYLQCSGNGTGEQDAGKRPPMLTGYFLSTPQMLSDLHTRMAQLTVKELKSQNQSYHPI